MNHAVPDHGSLTHDRDARYQSQRPAAPRRYVTFGSVPSSDKGRVANRVEATRLYSVRGTSASIRSG
jgi:hypothetical protein